jgi:hypothetical protein
VQADADLLVAPPGGRQLRDLQFLPGQRLGVARHPPLPGRRRGREFRGGALGPGGRAQQLEGGQRRLEVVP